MAAVPVPDWTANDWVHDWCDDDDSVTLTLVRWGDDYRLDFPDLCEFILQPGQASILVNPHGELDAPTLEHLLVDQVLPRYFAHEGALMVHASAVAVGDHTALFLGKSGWGKSTLAGLLDALGYSVLSDDCVMVAMHEGRIQARATYASLRLFEDSLREAFGQLPATSPVATYTDKRRLLLPARPCNEARPIRAIYLLNDPADAVDALEIEACGALEMCMGLIRHSFQLDLTDAVRTRGLLAQASAVAAALPAFHLRYPRDYAAAPAIAAAVARHVAALPPLPPES
jgi:hypothetical protein